MTLVPGSDRAHAVARYSTSRPMMQASHSRPMMTVSRSSIRSAEAGQHVEFTVAQVRGALAGIPAGQVAGLVIAYEPVWAIGTGEVATPEDAQEVCGAIRRAVTELYDEATGQSVRIQYGGSVKPGSVTAIMAKPDIDGALVGGASLKPDDFAAIVRFYAMAQA